MFDDGVIKPNPNGGYMPVTDPAEQESIRKSVTLSKRKQTLSPAEANQIQQNLPDDHNDAEDYGLE